MATKEENLRLNNELKRQLTSLIISSPKGLTVQSLQCDYFELIGAPVPFKNLGYVSFEQYLLNNPDICRLCGTGNKATIIPVTNENNKHINDMIMKQKPPKTNTRYKNIRRFKGIHNSKPVSESIKKPEIKTKIPVVNPNSHEVVLPPPHDYLLDCQKEKRKQTKESQQNKANPNDNSPNACSSTENIELFNDQFSDEFDESNNFWDFSYVSSDECEDLTTSVNNLVLTQDEYCPILDNLPVREAHVSRVNEKVQKKLRNLIAEYPDGIWCSKLLKLYQEKYKQKLDPANFGFTSVIQMCADLPNIFYHNRPNRTDWKLYDKSKPIPDLHSIRNFSKYLQTLPMPEQFQKNSEPPIPDSFIHISPQYNYPEYVMNPDEKIKRQWLVNGQKVEDYIEVIVSEVYDPSKFWIQLKGPDTLAAMDELMDNMQMYYMHNAEALRLNEFSVRIGLFCAALFMNEYHRAVIIKVFDDETIKVFYVDYGTVSEVSLNKTCLLHRDFMNLPMQAIKARLANIMPVEPNTMWPRSASQFMLNMVKEKVLIGYIYSIDQKQEILNLVLTDTTTDVDIHINDTLIEKNFAILAKEVPLCASSLAIVPNVHLYPSFEELEDGIYPTVRDLNTLLKLGHTYETIFNGYFRSANNSSYPDFNSSRCSTSNDSFLSPTFLNYSPTAEEQNVIADVESEDFIYEENFDKAEDTVSTIESNDCQDLKETISAVVDEPKEKIQHEEPLVTLPVEKEGEIVEEIVLNSNTIKVPPGFTEIPNNYSRNPYPNFIPANPVNVLQSYPLVQNHFVPLPNYPLVDLNLAYGLLPTNPLFYNQFLMQQQREVYFQTMRQYQLVNEIQNLNNFTYQQIINNQQRNKGQFYESKPEFSNLNLSDTKKENISNLPNQSTNKSSKSTTQVNQKIEIEDLNTSNTSEHICDRFVLKIQIQDSSFHVLKLDEEFFVITQEIISNLFKSKLSWKNWLKLKNIKSETFPNILTNLLNYESVYNQIKDLSIPGVNPSNNLGCNVRLTSLKDVATIVEKYGNKDVLQELKDSLMNIQKPHMWKVSDSSD